MMSKTRMPVAVSSPSFLPLGTKMRSVTEVITCCHFADDVIVADAADVDADADVDVDVCCLLY